MGKNPAFQYYPSDFDRDTAAVSLSARGAWITLMNAMWFTQNRGEITLPIVGYARLLGATVEQTVASLNELIEFDVCDAFSEQGREERITALHVTDSNAKITLVNRRMDREEKARKSTSLRVAKFRKANRNGESNANVTPPSSVLQSSVKENTHTNARAREPRAEERPRPSYFPEPVDQGPEITLYVRITGIRPPIITYDRIRAILKGKTEAEVFPFYEEWRALGFKAENLKWLEWVKSGVIPPRPGARAGPAPQGQQKPPCPECKQKDPDKREAHLWALEEKDALKQHLYDTLPAEEAQQRYATITSGWKTRRDRIAQDREAAPAGARNLRNSSGAS